MENDELFTEVSNRESLLFVNEVCQGLQSLDSHRIVPPDRVPESTPRMV